VITWVPPAPKREENPASSSTPVDVDNNLTSGTVSAIILSTLSVVFSVSSTLVPVCNSIVMLSSDWSASGKNSVSMNIKSDIDPINTISASNITTFLW